MSTTLTDEVAQDTAETDDSLDDAGFIGVESTTPLPLGDDLHGHHQVKGPALKIKQPPGYLDRAKALLAPRGAPKRFIEFVAGIHMFRDLIRSEECDTPARAVLAARELSACVEGALTELVADMSLTINAVSAFALEIRTLVPEIYDSWVNLQFTIGKPLSMVTAKRNPFDLHREQMIEDGLEEGRLVAGAVTPTLSQLERLVGITRLTLEAELGITTVGEQLELDSAFADFLMARRISAAAESLLRPSGSQQKEFLDALKLKTQAKAFDKAFHKTIDKMRLRNQRRSRTVRVAVERKVTLAVDKAVQESTKTVTASA